MLARASSEAGARLRRSKSVSSVPRAAPPALEPLDPDVTQRHALAAATIAYARAHEHDAADRTKGRNTALSRTKSTSSRKSLTAQGSHFPPRESSNRSTQVPRVLQISSAGRQSRATTMTTEEFPSFYPTPSSERTLSAQPSKMLDENTRPNSQPKSHRQSATSSITTQQIRKARSMYYASSVQTGSPIARPPTKYLTTPPRTNVSPAPPVHPAPPRVRNQALLPVASPQLLVRVGAGETIDEARDQYLQRLQQREVKHKPSLFLVPFKKRQDRVKKKERPPSAGVVSFASQQAPSETGIEPFDDFGMPKQKKEKRSFSGSIKDKFRKVFRRTSNTGTILPVQQIDASREYFSYQSAQRMQHSSMDRGFEIPSPTDDALERHQSRSQTPNLERASSPLARPSSRSSNRSRGSNRSLHSETNGSQQSSRVTSWSDSSAGGTITQRDIKRLTVIHEAKDSIGSDADRSMSASSLPRMTLPPTGIAAFRGPMFMDSLMEQVSTPVDPKHVFSALMKEIDVSKISNGTMGVPQHSPSAESDVFESSTTKELHFIAPQDLHPRNSKECRSSLGSDQRPSSCQRPNTARSKTSSIKSIGRALKSTIRTVTPTEHVSSFLERTTSVRGVVRIPRPSTAGSFESTGLESQKESEDSHVVHSINFRKGVSSNRPSTEGSHAANIVTPSAEQIEKRVGRSNDRWKTPLGESQVSEGLHFSQGRDISTTKFATQTSLSTNLTTVGMPPFAELEGDSPTGIAQQTTPTAASPWLSRPKQLFSPISPSIYSRNTDGTSIIPNDSVVSFDGASDDHSNDHEHAPSGEGSAVITSHAVKSYVIGTPSPRRRTNSTRSSRDWKAWLSHEVSELGSPVNKDFTIYDQYTPVARHHREITQIEEDNDTTITKRASMNIVTLRPGARRNHTVIELPLKHVIASTEVSQETSIEVQPTSKPIKASLERGVCPSIDLSSVPRKERLSSARSEASSISHSRSSTPKSSRMNDRFPFIKTGRRSSSQSTGLRRSSRTPTEGSSGSSSVKSRISKTTPSPKVYSDFSAPGSAQTSQYEPKRHSKRVEEVIIGKENRRENLDVAATLRGQEQSGSECTPFLPLHTWRPKSLLPLASEALVRSPSKLALYTTTAEELQVTKHVLPSDLAANSQRQGSRFHTRQSPGKLSTRTKSAHDLRGLPTLLASRATPTLQGHASSNSPTKERHYRNTGGSFVQPKHTLLRSSVVDSDAPRTLFKSSEMLPRQPFSPHLSSEFTSNVSSKSKLRAKHSSSTLALNKEPSPGSEKRNIDTIIDERPPSQKSCAVRMASVKGSIEGSGRVTPGHQMAEQFLRMSATRETESPVSMRSVKSVGGLRRGDTPTFL